MRIPRIFVAGDLTLGGNIHLPDDAAHYVTRVLRMEAGRPLIVFNGQGGEYAAEIIQVTKHQCQIHLQQFIADNRVSPLHTHLAIGISKGERFEWVLQKAVELGVSAITPLFSERTEVRLKGDRQEKKFEHWQKIIISAAEQCQSNKLPQLFPAEDFVQYLQQDTADLKLVLHHRSQHKLTQHTTPQRVSLLIGPEGGLSDQEIQQAQNTGFSPLTLGPRVLRTETAPIAALSLVQFLWGDLG